MKKITLLLFMIVSMVAQSNAQDQVLASFDEDPRLATTANAGASGFFTDNPASVVDLNESAKSLCFVRAFNVNAHAAVYFTLAEGNTVTVPAGEKRYVHLLVNASTPVDVRFKIAGVMYASITNVDEGGLITTAGQWIDMVFEMDNTAGATDIINNYVEIRGDQTVILPRAISLEAAKNTIAPDNSDASLLAGEGYVYLDEMILNNDPLPRGGVVTANPAKIVNTPNIYSSNGKIFINNSSAISTAVLYNSVGQKLTTKTFTNSCDFNVSKSGLYLIQLNGKTTKVIVRK